MDESRLAGTTRNVGKAQEAFGRTTGETKTEAKGVVNRLKGTAQDLSGQARDNAAEVASAERETGSSFERLLRNTIERQPCTAPAVTLGIG